MTLISSLFRFDFYLLEFSIAHGNRLVLIQPDHKLIIVSIFEQTVNILHETSLIWRSTYKTIFRMYVFPLTKYMWLHIWIALSRPDRSRIFRRCRIWKTNIFEEISGFYINGDEICGGHIILACKLFVSLYILTYSHNNF